MPAESYSDERLDKTLAELKSTFRKQFDVKDESDVEWVVFSFAPGRLNIIGEHTDYMAGWVTPAAVLEGTHFLVGRVKHLADADEKPKLRFYSTLYDAHYEMDAVRTGNDHSKDWRVFVRGSVTLCLEQLGLDVNAPQMRGICFLAHGTLAMGAGMSASAAFCTALSLALNAVATDSYKKPVALLPGRRYHVMPQLPRETLVELAKQARAVEVDFCGVNVGIMDQFASALCEDSKFMFLDCSALEFENFTVDPLLGNTHCFLLIDSMIKHDLAGGTAAAYNEVRHDQEEAQRKITEHIFNGKKTFTFSAFVRDTASFNVEGRTYTAETRDQIMEDVKPHLTPNEYDRGLYQLQEQQRTFAFKTLNDGSNDSLTQAERLEKAGALLNQTHVGLRDLLKVSTPEVDLVQSTVLADPDTVAARLLGGGFGGCVIVLLKKSAEERVLADVRKKFAAKFGVENAAYPVNHLGCGAFTVSLAPEQQDK